MASSVAIHQRALLISVSKDVRTVRQPDAEGFPAYQRQTWCTRELPLSNC